MHGLGEGHYALEIDPRKQQVALDCLHDGYLMAAAIAGGDLWESPTAVAKYKALCDYLKANYGITKIILWAQSMGGLPACGLIEAGTVPEICGALFTYPLLLKGEFGLPVTRDYTKFTMPVRLFASYGDGTASRADNADPFALGVTPYAPEHQIVPATGDHGDRSHFPSTDYRAAFARWR